MAKKKADAAGLAKAIRQCVDSGKVIFGSRFGIKASLLGKAKLIVVAQNCPQHLAQDIQKFCKLSSVPLIVFSGSSVELGTVAGRPHPVAVLTVLDPGTSGIMGFVA
ncbi:MAG: 50S ribosomal protein L30e [Candidatus Micrarchaeota archaeon]|nr:50S ribosomal protein L30e [Candidatus Micrarchaeota archaeon]